MNENWKKIVEVASYLTQNRFQIHNTNTYNSKEQDPKQSYLADIVSIHSIQPSVRFTHTEAESILLFLKLKN